MQIQLREGEVLRCAEAVLQGATHETAQTESWRRRKSIAEAVVEEGARKDLSGSKTER
jgi:hypothetical protein